VSGFSVVDSIATVTSEAGLHVITSHLSPIKLINRALNAARKSILGYLDATLKREIVDERHRGGQYFGKKHGVFQRTIRLINRE